MDWTDWTALVLGSLLGLGLNASRQTSNRAVPDDRPSPAYQAALDLVQFKSSFLARTSHELRSPMNALISSLQLIQSDLCDSPEEEREYVGIAHDAALKFIGLLDEVIKVSKLQSGTLRVQETAVDLSFVLQEVYFMTRLQAENRNLRLVIPMLEEEYLVRSDETYLRQAIVILVDRVIAILDEGTIEVVLTEDADRIYLTLPDPEIRPDQEASVVPPEIPTNFTPEFRRLLAQEMLSVIKIPLTVQPESRSLQLSLQKCEA